MKNLYLSLLYCFFLSTTLLGCSQQDAATEQTASSVPTPGEQTTVVDQASTEPEEAPVLQPALPVTENPDHESLLSSDDPQLAANKRFVYDMWRTLVDAHDVEAAKKYIHEGYIQHNPIADTGRAGAFAYFSSLGDPLPIQERVQSKLVAIVAEKDLVCLVHVDEQTEPRPYSTTWFDMFRIEDGMIVEHWDHGTLPDGVDSPRGYVPTVVNPDYRASIASANPQLQTNKQLVYDMWRTLLDAQQVEEGPRFLAKDYIQHNPLANTGLEGFMTFFRMIADPQPVQPTVKNFIEIIAEDDLVVLATVRSYNDANNNPYTTTWFDMFRIGDGMLVEHWDTAKLPVAPPSPPTE